MIVGILRHDDTLSLVFSHLMKSYESASSIISESLPLTGDSFGKALKRMVAQCSLDGEKDGECRIEHMKKWIERVFLLPAMEAIAAYNRYECLKRIFQKEYGVKYDSSVHPSLPKRPLPLALTRSAKPSPRDTMAFSQNFAKKEVRGHEIDALRASPVAKTPNKRHLSNIANDSRTSNKRPRKKQSSFLRWRGDMKENIPPTMSHRSLPSQMQGSCTTSATTSGRGFTRRGGYSPSPVFPLPDTDVKPIIKANGRLLLPRSANVLSL
ncbi:uncharacterized protein BT62DRAFT_26805 [Guyanagaster necrorhizus]|uniref:Uncharacterized protein n=1 Tax=Guyanagaster necrorhizus TaxID=856835 RepID=A0A9P7W546_9AGAR|nr:uncharacterized protein BT62DRAFT_26805 [Guyanagaster necrorhizus MCA 3950]KAG7452792.1 hypothetical protein BT62DRAFT_26805 [Guyanagaster necrorhizus MCA 3950]